MSPPYRIPGKVEKEQSNVRKLSGLVNREFERICSGLNLTIRGQALVKLDSSFRYIHFVSSTFSEKIKVIGVDLPDYDERYDARLEIPLEFRDVENISFRAELRGNPSTHGKFLAIKWVSIGKGETNKYFMHYATNDIRYTRDRFYSLINWKIPEQN